MKIEVEQKVEIYEIDDEEVSTNKKLEVNSHWNRDEFVVLKFEGISITVDADNLRDAIRNATNTGI